MAIGITARRKGGILFLSFSCYFIKRRLFFSLQLINDTTMCAVDGHLFTFFSLWRVI